MLSFFLGDQESEDMRSELEQLEVRVSNGDPSQLDYLRVAHAAAVVASRDGVVIADVKASSCKTEREREKKPQEVRVWSDTPSSFHRGIKLLLWTSNPAAVKIKDRYTGG